MRRLTPAFVALVLVVSALAAAPAAAMAQETQTSTDQAETQTPTDQADENATVAPGAQLAGVVGVGEAELEGDIESRSFGIRIAQAATNDSKAAVVADQLNESEARVAALERQREQLQQARENGSMSDGEYRARMAQLHAESRTVSHLANETNATASDLPAETLEANGVNATAIRTLSERADELSGPEVAEIARSIAGESARPDVAKNQSVGASDRGDNETDGALGERSGAGNADAANGTNETADGAGTDSETGPSSADDTGSNSTDSTDGSSTSDASGADSADSTDGSSSADDTDSDSTGSDGGSSASDGNSGSDRGR